MAHQHHIRSLHRKTALALSSQHRSKIQQSLTQSFGPVKGLPPIQERLNSFSITAWMFNDHHGPSRLTEVFRQPMEMLRISAQTRHEQQPRSISWRFR